MTTKCISSVHVRAARQPDLEEMLGIEQACFSDAPWDAESLTRYDCAVAEIDCIVRGFLISRELVPNYEGLGGEREILNLAVNPRWRRQGIARALLEYEIGRGGTLFLEVRNSNAAAQSLYKSCGFIEIGRRDDYYESPSETAIVMRLK
jgi:ribosomal protein S18 acetylase RimI-like enzyme